MWISRSIPPFLGFVELVDLFVLGCLGGFWYVWVFRFWSSVKCNVGSNLWEFYPKLLDYDCDDTCMYADLLRIISRIMFCLFGTCVIINSLSLELELIISCLVGFYSFWWMEGREIGEFGGLGDCCDRRCSYKITEIASRKAYTQLIFLMKVCFCKSLWCY